MIKTLKLELPLSRTYFHGSKGVRAIEVLLYIVEDKLSLKTSTRMTVQGQLVQPTVCFSDLQACEELSHSFIVQKPNNIMLRQQTLFLTSVPIILKSMHERQAQFMTILRSDLQV